MKTYKGQFNPTPKGLTLLEIVDYFPTDDKAREHLESLTWPNGPTCPRCGTNDGARISKVKANPAKKVRAGLYCCKDCRKQFTVTTNSIFESTHIPLRKWLIAWYLLCSSKKGISSLQLQRNLDLGSYRTALFMTHRIRHALRDPVFNAQLKGVVECDEAYIGGKPRHANNGNGETKYYPKSAVFTLAEREGDKRTFVIDNMTGGTVVAKIQEHVAAGAQVVTDESKLYPGVKQTHDHATVNHSAKEYFRREGDKRIHSNTVESSFSLLKRGVYGVFHHISGKHLPKYVAEFDHRWNTRHDSDTARTQAGIKKVRGKRLTYKQMVGTASRPLKFVKPTAKVEKPVSTKKKRKPANRKPRWRVFQAPDGTIRSEKL